MNYLNIAERILTENGVILSIIQKIDVGQPGISSADQHILSRCLVSSIMKYAGENEVDLKVIRSIWTEMKKIQPTLSCLDDDDLLNHRYGTFATRLNNEKKLLASRGVIKRRNKIPSKNAVNFDLSILEAFSFIPDNEITSHVQQNTEQLYTDFKNDFTKTWSYTKHIFTAKPFLWTLLYQDKLSMTTAQAAEKIFLSLKKIVGVDCSPDDILSQYGLEHISEYVLKKKVTKFWNVGENNNNNSFIVSKKTLLFKTNIDEIVFENSFHGIVQFYCFTGLSNYKLPVSINAVIKFLDVLIAKPENTINKNLKPTIEKISLLQL
uniref:Restriction endonuclease n=1 Tax=Strongyloides papillosus TaxID=174720 RepID=A0A0N5C3F1_STREA